LSRKTTRQLLTSNKPVIFKKDEPVIKKNFINRLVFFIGWILSPFTSWNDIFINIPIAYICARILSHFIRADFIVMLLVFYWITNIIGIVMMAVSGASIIRGRKNLRRELIITVSAMIAYSLVMVLLARLGIIR